MADQQEYQEQLPPEEVQKSGPQSQNNLQEQEMAENLVNQQPLRSVGFGSSQVSYIDPSKQSIKGESRVEYYPIEKRAIEYEQVEKVYVDQVPMQHFGNVPHERKVIEQVPKEKVWTEYQAVEYQKEYVPRSVYHTVSEQVPVSKVEYVPVTKVEYVPRETVEYVTQNKQVERVEYDEIEYQVQRPQQVVTQTQQVPVTSLGASQVVVQQPAQVVVQQPATVLQSSQVVVQPPKPQTLVTSVVRPPLCGSVVKVEPMGTSVVRTQPLVSQSLGASVVKVAPQTTVIYPPGYPTSYSPHKSQHVKRQQEPEEKGILDQIFD